MGLAFNDLCELNDVEIKYVSLMMHNTTAEPLRSMLPWIAAERRDAFEAYIRVHSIQATAALKNRPLVAIFLPFQSGRSLFEGLYQVAGVEALPARDIYSDPAYREIATTYGDTQSDPDRNTELYDVQEAFQFAPLSALSDFRGRVVVGRPGGRNYLRVAKNTNLEIFEISERPMMEMPPSDWREHVRGDSGVTVELRARNTASFRFSILQLFAPTDDIESVVEVENNWKMRLDTIAHGLNLS